MDSTAYIYVISNASILILTCVCLYEFMYVCIATHPQAEVRGKQTEELKKEIDRLVRDFRKSESETRARDARLARAVEEVEKYRKLLEEVKKAGKTPRLLHLSLAVYALIDK